MWGQPFRIFLLFSFRIVIMPDEFMKGQACLFLKYLWMLHCMSVSREMLKDSTRKPGLEKLKVNLDVITFFCISETLV